MCAAVRRIIKYIIDRIQYCSSLDQLSLDIILAATGAQCSMHEDGRSLRGLQETELNPTLGGSVAPVTCTHCMIAWRTSFHATYSASSRGSPPKIDSEKFSSPGSRLEDLSKKSDGVGASEAYHIALATVATRPETKFKCLITWKGLLKHWISKKNKNQSGEARVPSVCFGGENSPARDGEQTLNFTR